MSKLLEIADYIEGPDFELDQQQGWGMVIYVDGWHRRKLCGCVGVACEKVLRTDQGINPTTGKPWRRSYSAEGGEYELAKHFNISKEHLREKLNRYKPLAPPNEDPFSAEPWIVAPPLVFRLLARDHPGK